MTGSNPFSISRVQVFERTLKTFVGKYSKGERPKLTQCILGLLNDLSLDPFRAGSSEEPFPDGLGIDRTVMSFRKFRLRYAKGASGQLRLIYLVFPEERILTPLWIYSHEEYVKRPSVGMISSAVREALDELLEDDREA